VTEAVLAELQWRFAEARRMQIDGLEHLETARAERRGVLLVGAHVGPMLNLLHGLAGRGLNVYVAGGHPPSEPLPPGREGRWVAEQNRRLELAGCRWVHKGGAFPLLRTLLGRGELVWIAVDAPGSVTASFAGRRVSVGRGPAALALETGAPVIPAFALRRGLGERGLLLEPIDPRGFKRVEDLAQLLLDVVADVVAREPDQAHTTLLWLLRQPPVTEERVDQA
jgi:KDO2-lipid IV(A) lauroyltransferase